ncbi:MAG: hypothetical protein K9L64_05345 [Candidatus Izimaplasma sp.]|nr:hypothetical protein [Candidatus Izimaplasma bacterium]
MNVIDWILKYDVFIQYLVNRDLLEIDDNKLHNLRQRILTEGFGLELIKKQDLKNYTWGGGVYSPKYISTHYTLLELCQLGAPLKNERFINALKILFDVMWKNKGKVKPYRHQDLCVVAMMIRIACETGYKDQKLFEMVDYILEHQMIDGGWNCAWERKPQPRQSSLHTTLSVLEAFYVYKHLGCSYLIDKINEKIFDGVEYILSKKMFRSVRTNQIIHKDMLSFPFPYGWKYDILRAFTVMANLNIPYDIRMKESLNYIKSKLDYCGRIKADKKPPGLHHFRYTKTNQLCPYNTYRVLKVLKYYSRSKYDGYLNKDI